MNIFNRKPKKPDPFPYKLSRELHEDWRDFAWEKMAVPTMAKAIVPTVPTEPLVALHCSSCGAPFNPTTRQCKYCGTWFGSKPQTKDDLRRASQQMADIMTASDKFRRLGLLLG